MCPTGASHHWNDSNIVLVDAEKCTGCKACIAACPYDARLVMHPDGYIDKCTFCHHRVEKGLDRVQLPNEMHAFRFAGRLEQ